MNPPQAAANLTALYQRETARLGYQADQAQLAAVAALERIRTQLIEAPARNGLLNGLLSRRTAKTPVRGLYLWGGVGRGKTWLMDLFFASLPFKEKQRSHFHRFMQSVHEELKRLKDQADPLELVAEKVARKTRVLCFDELFVTDIADAMLLGTLFRGLFERGVTLVATSNVPPDDLYKEGLQRARFLPAIKLIKQHTEVLRTDGGTDYRLRLLERATTWFMDRGFGERAADTTAHLEQLFAAIAGDDAKLDGTLTINHRRIRVQRQADDAVWFDFKEICEGPRSQADYIELAKCYHTVFITHVPALTANDDNAARRFMTLVDEFYDRNVKLIVSAATPIVELYGGAKLKFEFERTKSRLIEMQSQEYLAREHRP